MYDELNAAFPKHSFFYEVNNLTFGEALERCARLTGGDGELLNYQGKIIFAVDHTLGNEIEFLTAVEGSPIDVTSTE
jgi:hypothetical protein